MGAAIRNPRLDQLMTQQQLGHKAVFHRADITYVENRLRNISFLTLIRIANALQCPLPQIIGDTENHKE